jgi:FecR protein
MKRHQFLHILFIIFIAGGLLLSSIHASAASSRGLAVPKSALPAELGPLDIKDYYAAVGIKAVGKIKSVMGHVVVFREDRRYAYYAAPGDGIFERDVVYTLKGSRCRVQLDTSDVATMGENTRLMIKAYLDNRQTKVKSTTFAMNRGKSMFYALRLFKYRGASMEVETPTAVSGVRGTKWGIEVVELSGKPVASLPVQVADLSDAGFRHLAQANQPQFQTNVYSFEGSIRVTSTITGLSTTLSGGQGLNAGGAFLVNPVTTPPGVATQFQNDTYGGGGEVFDLRMAGGRTDRESTLPDIISVTQNQNTSNLGIEPTRPTNHEGFFGIMLAMTNPSTSFDSRMMSTTAQDFNSSPIQASDPFGGSASITANGSSGSFNPTITDVRESGGMPMMSGVPVTVNPTELGYNAYVEWGYWTQPQPMSYIDTYAFIDRGYYVQGDVTTNAQMAALKASSVVGTYTGKAYGTYSDSSGVGYYMPNGTFNATVNFSTPSIPSFNFSVTDGTHTASVTGASGSFSGSTGQFNVTGGTVSLTGSATPSQKSYGAIYGSNGQAIGGVWSIKDPSNNAAAIGVFQGVR